MALSEDQKTKLCAAARAYIGVPWRGQGRDHQGVDCNGFIVCAYRDAGFEVDEGPVDYRGVDSKRLVATIRKYCDRINPGGNGYEIGDIIVLGYAFDAHVALLIDGDPLNVMHAPAFRKVVESRFDRKRGRIRSVYRWR